MTHPQFILNNNKNHDNDSSCIWLVHHKFLEVAEILQRRVFKHLLEYSVERSFAGKNLSYGCIAVGSERMHRPQPLTCRQSKLYVKGLSLRDSFLPCLPNSM